MWDSFFHSKDFGAVAFFAVIFGAVVATTAISAWRKHLATKMEYELKMEMLGRGMSADDIQRVLNAKSKELADTLANDD